MFSVKKYYHRVLLSLILFFSLFFRFYQLGYIPHGFYQDESAIGYNAYSISQTGKDEYGKTFPLYFKSFGDWKLPVYIYSVVITTKIFGLSEFAVRLPSAIFGFFTVIITYLFVKKYLSLNLALSTAFLLALNPWSLHYNRATFEVSIALFFFVLGSYLLFDISQKGRFFLGTFCFILALYTYNLTRLLAPVLYISNVLFNISAIKKIPKFEKLVTGFLLIFLLVPFFLSFFAPGGITSARGTLIFSSQAVRAPLIELRSYFTNLPGFFTKIFFNLFNLIAWQYLRNIISYLSVNFFFLTGSSHGNHGIGNNGQFYLAELLFIILGFVRFLKNHQSKITRFLFTWTIITVLIASLTREAPHATRSFFLIFPLEIFSAAGLLEIINLRKDQSMIIKAIPVILAVIFVYNLIYYFTSYYVYFPVAYAKSWKLTDKYLASYLKRIVSSSDRIIIDRDANLVYSSILFFQKFPPQEFQDTVIRAPDNHEGFSEVISFGKYLYKKIDWEKDVKPRTVFITSQNSAPGSVHLVETFKYPKRPVVLSLKEEIIQYPYEEVSYYVYKTHIE